MAMSNVMNNTNNNKMKGLLKGLRYISQIFEDEKESEMQIGHPTDVKHLAHVGIDSQSADTSGKPSWMNEFKSEQEGSGQVQETKKEQEGSKYRSEGNNVESKEPIRTTVVHKTTRRNTSDIPSTIEKSSSDRPRRRSSNVNKTYNQEESNTAGSENRRARRAKDHQEGDQHNNEANDHRDVPKKPHRKKTRDETKRTSKNKQVGEVSASRASERSTTDQHNVSTSANQVDHHQEDFLAADLKSKEEREGKLQ